MANKERHRGIPRTDTERAMSHYGITEEEYLAHPDWYPLPPRGSGFEEGRAAIGGGGADTNVGGGGNRHTCYCSLGGRVPPDKEGGLKCKRQLP